MDDYWSIIKTVNTGTHPFAPTPVGLILDAKSRASETEKPPYHFELFVTSTCRSQHGTLQLGTRPSWTRSKYPISSPQWFYWRQGRMANQAQRARQYCAPILCKARRAYFTFTFHRSNQCREQLVGGENRSSHIQSHSETAETRHFPTRSPSTRPMSSHFQHGIHQIQGLDRMDYRDHFLALSSPTNIIVQRTTDSRGWMVGETH